jgi:shikimate dehydrogenase
VAGLSSRYGVVGHPIAHSRSPFIHAAFARATGQDLEYAAFDVAPEKFCDWVPAFFARGGGGLNLTIPHKEAAAALAEVLTPRAALAGAVNTLTPLPGGRLEGDNTDGAGLLADLRGRLECDLRGARILVLGAGGAARGILGPLLDCTPDELVVANRTAARATELAARFTAHRPVTGMGFDALAEHAGPPFALVLEASASALHGAVPPLPAAAVGPATLCYDLAYAGGDTPFQRRARELGAGRAEQGLGMLVEQAALAFERWRGVRPATAPVLAALRTALQANPRAHP